MNSLWLESANLHLHSLLLLISLVMIFSMMRIKRRSPQITVAVKTWSNMEHLMTWICPLHPPPTPTRHHCALCFLSVTHNTVPLPCALTLHIGIHVVQLLDRSTLYQKTYFALQLTGQPPPNQSNTLHTNVGFQICRADNLVITLHTFSECFISWRRRTLDLR